jgi:sarcosine oxidase, subunit beta
MITTIIVPSTIKSPNSWFRYNQTLDVVVFITQHSNQRDMENRPIVVVGGGIVGSSIAYHLSNKSDQPVIVLERQSLSSETTTKSAAFVGYYGGETDARIQMKQYGIKLFNKIVHEPRTQVSTHVGGRINIATTKEGSQILEENAQSDRISAKGAIVEYFDGESLSGSILSPDLNFNNIKGAIYRPNISYTRPVELGFEFAERAKSNGVEFRTNTKVEKVNVEGDNVTSVKTTENTIQTNTVICAAGPWTPALIKSAGIEVPVEHSIGPVLILENDSIKNTIPSIKHEESGLYLRHDTGGRFFLGHRPSSGQVYDPDRIADKVEMDFKQMVSETLPTIIPAMADADIHEEWVGLRTLTPDPNPIIGCTNVDGLYMTAFNGDGIMLAPAAGKIIASQVIDNNPTKYYPNVSLSRFNGFEDTFSDKIS